MTATAIPENYFLRDIEKQPGLRQATAHLQTVRIYQNCDLFCNIKCDCDNLLPVDKRPTLQICFSVAATAKRKAISSDGFFLLF